MDVSYLNDNDDAIACITLASMGSAAIVGYLVSNVLRGLHASLLNMTFGPLDTVFMVTGILVIGAGAYAMLALRGVALSGEQPVISARCQKQRRSCQNLTMFSLN